MPDHRDFSVYQLLFSMVRAVVVHPREVKIKTVWSDDGVTFTVEVHAEDIGKLIGEKHKTATSIRTIVTEAGLKVGRRVTVIIEQEPVPI